MVTVSRAEIVELNQRINDPMDVDEPVFRYLCSKLVATEERIAFGTLRTQTAMRAEVASWLQ